MNVETMLRVAAVSSLSPELQHRLWASEDRLVRRALAKRLDLIEAIAAQVVRDPDLVATWASVRRTGDDLLDVAVRHAQDEHSIMELSRQTDLTSEQAELLAVRCTPVVGWYLLEHQGHRLSEATSRMLVMRHVGAMEPRHDSPGRIFSETLGEDDLLWTAVADAVDVNTIGLLRVVASRAASKVVLHEPVVAALERITGSGSVLDERAGRAVHGVTEDLLRSTQLTPEIIDRLAALPLLAPLSATINLRRHLNLAGLLASLDCNLSAHDPDSIGTHVEALKRLLTLPGYTQLPVRIVARAAIAHRDLLSEAELVLLLQFCRGPELRRLAAEFIDHGRFEDVAKMTEILGTVCIDSLPDPSPVLVLLARAGSAQITDRSVPAEALEPVALSFRPLRQLLREPGLASVVVKYLEGLEPVERDVAFGLLGEWEGDLYELVAGARSLARNI